jgi:hypothetical protein
MWSTRSTLCPMVTGPKKTTPTPVDESLVQEWERRFAELPPDQQAIVDAAAAADEEYGDDFERERADLDAGQHPTQKDIGAAE